VAYIKSRVWNFNNQEEAHVNHVYLLTHGAQVFEQGNPGLLQEGYLEIESLGIQKKGFFQSLDIRLMVIGLNFRCEGTGMAILPFVQETLAKEPFYDVFLGTEDIVNKVGGNIVVISGFETQVPADHCILLSNSRAWRSVAWKHLQEELDTLAPGNKLLVGTSQALYSLGVAQKWVGTASLYQLDLTKELVWCHAFRGMFLAKPRLIKGINA